MFASKCIPRTLCRSRSIPLCRNILLRSEGRTLTTLVWDTEANHFPSGHRFQQTLPWCSARGNSASLLVGRHAARSFQTASIRFDDVRIVSTPPFAESVTEGNVKWLKAVGDAVAEDEVVGEIETDKTALPVTAPASGTIEELLVEDDARVEKGDQLFKLRIGGSAPATTASPKAEPPPAAKVDAPASPSPVPPATPTQQAHPPSTMPPIPSLPTAPASVSQASKVPPPPSSQLASQTVAKDAPVSLSGTRTETRVKMSRMRQRIAARLKESQNMNAMLTTFNEVDMSNIMQLRQQHKDAFVKKHGLKLGFMSVFVKASSNGLEAMPGVNAVIDGDAIVYRDYVDISVAVATPKGLVVPVLRDVQHLDFAGIELGINALGVKARDGNLAIEDMEGGTFTISNGGVFGSLMGTPIINPPQSAILGMHAIFDRPVAINGKVEIRPMMYIALTYDHRLIDGREAVTFLKRIKTAVEDPRVLLLNL